MRTKAQKEIHQVKLAFKYELTWCNTMACIRSNSWSIHK